MKRLNAVSVISAVKKSLSSYRAANPLLSQIMERLELSGDIYIVGGYIRNVCLGGKVRDIDLMVDMDSAKLHNIVKDSGSLYTYNRHGGMKLYTDSVVADIWTMNENWAFKTNSVSLRDDAKLNSIAQGCFYNFDSLVVRLRDYRYNFKYFEEFLNTRKLDILKDANYQARNPMLEANILRAFYIKKEYGITFSDRVNKYIFDEIVNLDMYGFNVWERIAIYKEKYPKYKSLDFDSIKKEVQEIMCEVISREPYLFDISHLLS